ncbi:DUF2514 family protein [Pseudomonas fulva]
MPRAAVALSDLLTLADARAAELVKAYDQARIADDLCDPSYNALIR